MSRNLSDGLDLQGKERIREGDGELPESVADDVGRLETGDLLLVGIGED